MTPTFVLVLVTTGGVISVTGLLASWVIRFESIAFETHTETTILAGTLAVAQDVSNRLRTQANTNFPGTASRISASGVTPALSVVSGVSSAINIVEASWKTTAEAAAVTTAGSGENAAAGGTISSSETPVNMEPSTKATLRKPVISPTVIVPVDKNEAHKTTGVSSTLAEEESETTKAGDTLLTATNILTTMKLKRFITVTSPYLLTTFNGLSTNPTLSETQSVKEFTQTHKSLLCKGKCKTKPTTKNPAGRHDQEMVPMTHEKTLYSAITMGCILLSCSVFYVLLIFCL